MVPERSNGMAQHAGKPCQCYCRQPQGAGALSGRLGFGVSHVGGRASEFVGYDGEESLVEGAWVEEEKSSCSKRAIMALLCLSCSFSILKRSVSCSISSTGCQFNLANQRRHGDKVERDSDLLIESELGESEEVDIAIACDERNQDQQEAADQGCSCLAVKAGAALTPAHR
jgi:hypothetical protein